MTHAHPEVVTIGESMGLFFPPSGRPISSRPPFHLSFGGAESNVAIGLARLGHRVTWVGRLGDDELGEFINRELTAEGVTTPSLFGPSHTGIMVRGPKGLGRTAVQYARSGSAGASLTPADLPVADIVSARVLHLTGITAALGPGPLETVLAAAAVARQAGVTVTLDLNYRASLWSEDVATPVLRKLTASADVVFATTDEAAVLLGHPVTDIDDVAVAREVAALGPSQVIIKRGAEGAIALNGTVYTQHLTEVTECDPVGAGDAFAAGYIHGLLTSLGPQECLDFAGLVAAHSVTVVGDWEGLPTLDELGAEHRDILR
ncbi:sugar kinase [Leucobacter chinensis]|uniref:sugar kinase n=1 Tax=Leucobacter chinensis TaxID=2851010 RepID=UPI001C237BDC|nr:sugar kinase [Leucobacter chinensis]